MPSLQNVLAGIPGLAGFEAQNQLNREKEMGALQQAGGAMSLMDVLRKNQQQQAFASQMGDPGADQNALALQHFIKTNPDAYAKLLTENKSKQEQAAAEMARFGLGGEAQPAQQSPVGAFQGDPKQIMGEINRIADPAERAAAMQAFSGQMGGQGNGLPRQLAGITPEKALMMSASPNPQISAIGKMVSKHYEKVDQDQRTLEGKKEIVQMMQGGKTPPKTMAQIQEEEKIKAIGKAEGEAAALNVPGSKANTKLTDSVKKNKAIADTTAIKAKIVTDKVDEALAETGFFSTGLTGEILGMIPGTTAYNLESTLDTIKANVGFNELQAMRQASPTGGALGQVAVRELDMLQAVIASLKKGQSRDKLESSLNQVAKHYSNWKKAVDQANVQETSGSAPAASGGVKFLGFE